MENIQKSNDVVFSLASPAVTWRGSAACAEQPPAMFVLMALSSLTALLFVYIFMPALWTSIMAVDDSLDRHESGVALVASRNPFRETGPPANMAKLILLRHRMQTSSRKRRSPSCSRRSPRTYNMIPPTNNRLKASWIRFSRPFGGKQYH